MTFPGRFHGSIANASGFGSPNSFTFPVNGRYFFYLNTSFETTGEKHNPETKANTVGYKLKNITKLII